MTREDITSMLEEKLADMIRQDPETFKMIRRYSEHLKNLNLPGETATDVPDPNL
jgi:hypothetical protein